MLWQPYLSQCAALDVLHSHADWCTSKPRSSRGMHRQLCWLQIEALAALLSEYCTGTATVLPLVRYKWNNFSLFGAPSYLIGYLNTVDPAMVLLGGLGECTVWVDRVGRHDQHLAVGGLELTQPVPRNRHTKKNKVSLPIKRTNRLLKASFGVFS